MREIRRIKEETLGEFADFDNIWELKFLCSADDTTPEEKEGFVKEILVKIAALFQTFISIGKKAP